MSSSRRDRWAPTHALLRCLAVVVLTAPVALLWRRPDLVVLATPFAVVLAWMRWASSQNGGTRINLPHISHNSGLRRE